ncbi:MAG: hypothetical protein VYB54_05675 [Pseudomonadota bacterium]|nr:hypothetical protein [Pseudomonadota bacterium]
MDRVIGGSFGATVESSDGPEQAGFVAPAGGQAAGAADRASPVETVQATLPAATGAPQMVVGAVSGDVFVIHVDGRQGQVQQGDTLVPGDVVLTRGDGGIEVRLANGTTAFFDHDSRILVESPDAQSGSAQPQFFVIQGQFSINAQGVATDLANSLLVRTPVSTVTVRGARLLGKAAPEAQANTFVMLPAGNGAALGTVAVATAGALVVLDAPMQGLQVLSMFRAPTAISDIDVQTLIAQFSPGVLAYSDIGTASDLARAEGPTLLAQIQGLLGIGQAQAGEVLAGGAVGDGRGSGEVIGRTGDDDLSDRNIDDEEQGNVGEVVNDIAFDGDVAFSIANGDATLTGGAGFDKATIAADPVNANIVTAAVNEAGQIVLNFSGGTNSSVVLSGVEEVEIALGGAGDNVSLGDLSGSDLADDTFIIRAGGGDDFVDGALVGRSLDFDGGEGNDTLLGSTSDDLMVGGTGDDVIAGGAAGDVLRGEAGDDVLNGGSGDDLIAGGDGIDTADFSDDAAGVTASLLTGTATGVDSGNDTLTGIENLTGGSGDDSLTGDTGANALSGGIGDDTLIGNAGNDTLDGGADTDTVDYAAAAGPVAVDLDAGTATGDGTDSLVAIENAIGSANADTLSGTADDNLLVGNAGNDVLSGRAGDDTLQGGAGDDTIAGGDGNDSMAGGDGTDTADFSAATGNLVIDLTDGTASGEGEDALSGFERVVGGAGNDSISGTSGAQTLQGGAGDDTLNGRGDDDVLFGGDGFDRVEFGGDGSEAVFLEIADGSGVIVVDFFGSGAADDQGSTDTVGADVEQIAFPDLVLDLAVGTTGSDTLNLGDGNNLVFGLAGFDVINSGAGDDQIRGGNGSDTIFGGGGTDIILGENGDDVLVGGSGDDALSGGAGTDRVVFSGAIDGFVFSFLADGTNPDDVFEAIEISDSVGAEGTDLVAPDVEQLTFADRTFDLVLGSSDTNLVGIADTLTGGAGDDIIAGLSGDDVVSGGAGGDFLFGGTGDDTLSGGAGDDTLIGGDGVDTADFSGSATAVTVDLAAGTATGEGNDSLSGIEAVTGSAFDDSISGDDSANTLTGGLGNDTLAGRGGNDSFSLSTAASGNDLIDGGDGTDSLGVTLATAGNLSIAAAGATTSFAFTSPVAQTATTTNIEVVTVTGSTGNDTITATDTAGTAAPSVTASLGAGNDLFDAQGWATSVTVDGGTGNDTIRPGTAADSLNGGGGTGDVLDISFATNALSVVLTASRATGLDIGVDTVTGFETVIGGSGNDTLVGNNVDNLLVGGDGDDCLVGANGSDTFIGGLGNDTYDGSDALVDVVDYSASVSDLLLDVNAATFNVFELGIDSQVGTSIDGFIGGAGNDTMIGNAGVNRFDGGAGNDSISAAGGNDRIFGSLGNDTLDGGTGIDDLDYSNITTTGVNVNLVAGTASGPGNDVISGFENVTGTALADTISASDDANVIISGAGNDLVLALGGNDDITLGDGDDTVDGGTGADTIRGDGGNDSIAGGDGADSIFGAQGNDTIDGGDGADTISGGNDADLINGGAGNDSLNGDAGNDTVFGGIGDDQLAAVSGLNLLDGGEGDDTISGGNNVDTITGGLGSDVLTGNAGNDLFRYDSPLEGGDTITDFAAGADRFSILGSAFSNVASTGGVLDSSAFRNIAGALQDGTTDIGNAATFVFDTQNSVLHFDPDGTGGQASFEIATVTVASGTLQASDFEVR